MLTTVETSPPLRRSIASEFLAQTSPSGAAVPNEESLLANAFFGVDFVHEVNGPLATGLLAAQVALRSLSTAADPRARRCLEFTIESIQMASQAMRKYLRQFCAHEAQHCQFDACAVVRFTIAGMKGFADRHECRIESRICASPTDVSGNPIAIQLAIADALFGAIACGVRLVSISTITGDDCLKIVISEAADHSITRVDAESPDHTPDGATADHQPGHAFLHELIHSDGGSISYGADPNGGRTVTISLPRSRTA